VVHIAVELKQLVDAKDRGVIDKFEFYRMLNNIDEKIDALMQSGCSFVTVKEPEDVGCKECGN
jgi:hypothetical protein